MSNSPVINFTLKKIYSITPKRSGEFDALNAMLIACFIYSL